MRNSSCFRQTFEIRRMSIYLEILFFNENNCIPWIQTVKKAKDTSLFFFICVTRTFKKILEEKGNVSISDTR